MTVQYNQLVLTGGPGVFLRLLLKWRGCVFKLIYLDMVVFVILYAIISCIYRLVLPPGAQRTFEKVIIFTRNFQALIPVAFILGFYIQLIFSRFWAHFSNIPWIIKFAMSLSAQLPVPNERARLIGRTCVRYLMSSMVIAATRLHLAAKKRFPTNDHIVNAGILTHEEVNLISDIQPVNVQPFVPIVWATSLITMAEKEGLMKNTHAIVAIIDELNNFRQGLLNLFMMDHVCIPLVYTQVVTLSVYSYFVASLIGHQFIIDTSPLIESKGTKDLYIPLFTILEFVIYVGWLKVAETLVNPMGEDDEDFQINEIIDFNWKAAWCIMDNMKVNPPPVIRDIHWHQSVVSLPHTEESRRLISQPFRGSVYNINVPITPDMIGSGVSLSGIGHSQDIPQLHTTDRRSSGPSPMKSLKGHTSNASGDGEAISLTGLNPNATSNTDSSHHASASNIRKISGSSSPLFGSHTHIANKGLSDEPIKEEDEEDLESDDKSGRNQLPNSSSTDSDTTNPIELVSTKLSQTEATETSKV